MKLTFDHAEVEAPNISTFYFRPERSFSYVAGQYAELTLKHKNADNRGESRRFTLSSSPTDELVSITNKFSDKDGSSFKRALSELKPGDTLLMSEPMGDFVLPKDRTKPLIFVAGGIGITPFRSMIAWLLAEGEKRPIELFYGVRSEAEILSRPMFENAMDKMTILISNPSSAWTGERGYLTAKHIVESNMMGSDSLIYLSGPEAMVTGIQKELIALGVQRQQLVVDLFIGYDTA